MKSKDLQDLVLSKSQNGQKASDIFEELKFAVSLPTIKRWIKLFSENGAIDLKTSSGRKRVARCKKNLQTTKRLLKGKKKVTVRQLATKLNISIGSAYSILKKDLGLYPYKIRTEPKLTDDQKKNRVKFYHWVRNNFKKSETENILFSDEKWFKVDGVYNAQNDRIWSVDRAEADKQGGIHQKRKFSQGIMFWLGACSKGLSPLVIIKKERSKVMFTSIKFCQSRKNMVTRSSAIIGRTSKTVRPAIRGALEKS